MSQARSKTTKKPAAVKRPALVGGNLPDGSRFEAGDELGKLDADTLASLEANGIVAPAAKKGE